MVAWGIPHPSIQGSDSNSATSCRPLGRGEPRPVSIIPPLWVSILGLSTKAQSKDQQTAFPGKKVHFSSLNIRVSLTLRIWGEDEQLGFTHLCLWDLEVVRAETLCLHTLRQEECTVSCMYSESPGRMAAPASTFRSTPT